jgi:hypothetical protein
MQASCLGSSLPGRKRSRLAPIRRARSAVLPEVSLVILSPAIVHLHGHGRFIGLDIGAAQ